MGAINKELFMSFLIISKTIGISILVLGVIGFIVNFFANTGCDELEDCDIDWSLVDYAHQKATEIERRK